MPYVALGSGPLSGATREARESRLSGRKFPEGPQDAHEERNRESENEPRAHER